VRSILRNRNRQGPRLLRPGLPGQFHPIPAPQSPPTPGTLAALYRTGNIPRAWKERPRFGTDRTGAHS
jgi:hypothetical protein